MLLQEAGAMVLDADDVAREVMRPGQPVFDAVVKYFGKEILDATGAVDRGRLGRRVFAHPEERDALNRMVHPEVLRRCRRWVAERRAERARAAVIIPLLFEVGETQGWDAIVCVTSPEEEVRRRLRARGLSDEEIEQRLAAQWALAEKARRADYVIQNDGDWEHLRNEVKRVLTAIENKGR